MSLQGCVWVNCKYSLSVCSNITSKHNIESTVDELYTSEYFVNVLYTSEVVVDVMYTYECTVSRENNVSFSQSTETWQLRYLFLRYINIAGTPHAAAWYLM